MIAPKFHPHARLHVTGRDGTLELSRNAANLPRPGATERGRWCPTANNPNQPQPEKVNAYKADNSEKPIVIIHVHEFSLPEVLKHIEAGRIVRVILPEQ